MNETFYDRTMKKDSMYFEILVKAFGRYQAEKYWKRRKHYVNPDFMSVPECVKINIKLNEFLVQRNRVV